MKVHSEIERHVSHVIRLRQVNMFCVLLLAPFFAFQSSAQLDTAIVRTYGGPYFEEGKQIIECASGGYAIIGTTGSDQINNTNFYLLRLDSDLNCMWNKVLGGSDVEWGQSLVEDDAGNFMLCGYTNSEGAGGYDVLVIKVDAIGEVIWKKTYGGSDWDFGYKIIKHSQTGFLLCGKTYSYGNGGSDAYLLHIDDAGEVLHEWTYGGAGEDGFNSVLLLDDGQIIVGGHEQSANDQRFAWLISLGIDYVIQWQKLYEQFDNGSINDIKKSNDDFFLITGEYLTPGNPNNGFYEKLDAFGESSFFQSSNEFSVQSIAEGEDYLYVAGNTSLFGAGGSAALILRLDLYSTWLNGAAFGGVYDEAAHDLFIDSDNAVLLLGASSSYDINIVRDVYLVKFVNPVIVSDYDLDLSHEDCFAVNIGNDQEENEIEILQDPGSIRLNWIKGNYKVALYKLNGVCVFRSDNYSDGQTISVSDFSSSVYVLNISNDHEFYSRRIV